MGRGSGTIEFDHHTPQQLNFLFSNMREIPQISTGLHWRVVPSSLQLTRTGRFTVSLKLKDVRRKFRVRLVAMKMAVFSSIMTIIVFTAIINNGRVFGSP